jgi:hypothetical protein
VRIGVNNYKFLVIYLFLFTTIGCRIGVNNYNRYMHTEISARRCTHTHAHTHTHTHTHTRHGWRNLHFTMQSEQLSFSDFKRGVYILPQAMRYNFAEISVLVKFRGKMLDRKERKMEDLLSVSDWRFQC